MTKLNFKFDHRTFEAEAARLGVTVEAMLADDARLRSSSLRFVDAHVDGACAIQIHFEREAWDERAAARGPHNCWIVRRSLACNRRGAKRGDFATATTLVEAMAIGQAEWDRITAEEA